MEQSAGILLGAGSMLFLAAAFAPVSRVYVAPSLEQKLAIINASPTQWRLSHWGFGLGAAVAAGGYGLLALAQAGLGQALAMPGAALVAAGALLWAKHLSLRAVDPDGFARGQLPHWHFVAYSLLTMAGLLLFGAAYLVAGYPAWLGWLTVIGSVALFVFFVATRDLPPLMHYLLTLPAAIVLLA